MFCMPSLIAFHYKSFTCTENFDFTITWLTDVMKCCYNTVVLHHNLIGYATTKKML